MTPTEERAAQAAVRLAEELRVLANLAPKGAVSAAKVRDVASRALPIVERAVETLGGPDWKCRMCLWVIGVEGHAPDCPLKGDEDGA